MGILIPLVYRPPQFDSAELTIKVGKKLYKISPYAENSIDSEVWDEIKTKPAFLRRLQAGQLFVPTSTPIDTVSKEIKTAKPELEVVDASIPPVKQEKSAPEAVETQTPSPQEVTAEQKFSSGVSLPPSS